MKKTAAIVLFFCLVLTGLIGISFPASAQTADPAPTPTVTLLPCAAADAYLAAGLLTKAEAAYDAVLTLTPGEQCAVDGLKAIGQAKCNLAQTQQTAGDIDGARATYQAILLTQPGLTCAVDGLAALAPAGCADADQFMQQGAVSLAEGIYKKILETQPGQVCALTGLNQVALAKCAAAKTRAESGDLTGAKTAFEAILTDFPGMDCAVTGLAALSNDPEIIQGLVSIGKYDDAWTKLKTAIEGNPTDQRLKALARQPWAVGYAVKETLTSIVKVLLYILAVVASLAVLILLIAAIVNRSKLRLDVSAFDASAVETDETKKVALQAELLSRFEQALNRLGQSRRFNRPDLIDQPLQPLTLPTLSVLPEEVNQILKVFLDLFPPRLAVVTCRLEEDKEKGAGIAVRIVYNRNNALWGADTIWEKDVIPNYKPVKGTRKDSPVSPEDRFSALIEFAALRTYWKYCRGKYQKGSGEQLRQTFGTANFQSYVMTMQATGLQQRGKKFVKEARLMLQHALDNDPDNTVALLNLSQLIRQTDKAESTEYLNKITKMPHAGKPVPLPHIFANYLLGITQLESYLSTEVAKRDADQLKRATSFLGDAVRDVKHAVDQQVDITEELTAMIQIPYADALRNQNPADPGADKLVHNIIDEAYTAPRVNYNLACYFSTGATLPTAKPDSLDKSLCYLKRALRDNPRYAEDVADDHSLDNLKNGKKKDYEELRKQAMKRI